MTGRRTAMTDQRMKTRVLAIPVQTSILLFSAAAENNSSSCPTFGASHGVQPAGYGGKRPCLPLWKGELMKRGLSQLLVRRVCAVALILSFLFLLSVLPARAASLSDIVGRPDQAVIERGVAKGFMRGYPDGTFRPNVPVTRAEFIVAFARSAGLAPVQSPATTLKDLPTGNWASPLVYAAVAKGWVIGYPDGTFRPTARITREESMTVVAHRMDFEIRGMATHTVLDKVAGSEDLSQWARTAAAACLQEGMVTDVTRPTAAITRAQTAAYFPRVLDYKEPATQSMVLATTTSTFDSGLLTFLVPMFEKSNHVKVKIISVGTGQAITTGRKGDADVLLVHARAQEDLFMADGFGLFRKDVMYNDFIIVGPASDPAKIKDMTDATAAFKKLAASGSIFISRGDKSGTNTKELDIWKAAGITPASKSWYLSAGQGMGEVLMMTDQKQAYTLTDRATYLLSERWQDQPADPRPGIPGAAQSLRPHAREPRQVSNGQ